MFVRSVMLSDIPRFRCTFALIFGALTLAACASATDDAVVPAASASQPLTTDSASMVVAGPADSGVVLAGGIAADSAAVPAAAVTGDTLRRPAPDSAVADSAAADSAAPAAVDDGWPVDGPDPLPGAILPDRRIVAYYGNPLSRRMGILGELPPDQMLARLDEQVALWNEADPSTPVQPALHLIVVVAQGSAGRDGKWRSRMADTLVERVTEWAARRNALVFLDFQVGLSTLQEELPRYAHFFQRPNVHLGIDPEFSMKGGHRPGSRIGSFDARDVNYASSFLAELVTEHNIPPKVLVVHRFTQRMLTNAEDIRLDPRVQVVIHMDGWGPARLKRDSYRAYVHAEPVQFAGIKVFYKHDSRKPGAIMTPEQMLELHPKPVYIQYQ